MDAFDQMILQRIWFYASKTVHLFSETKAISHIFPFLIFFTLCEKNYEGVVVIVLQVFSFSHLFLTMFGSREERGKKMISIVWLRVNYLMEMFSWNITSWLRYIGVEGRKKERFIFFRGS